MNLIDNRATLCAEASRRLEKEGHVSNSRATRFIVTTNKKELCQCHCCFSYYHLHASVKYIENGLCANCSKELDWLEDNITRPSLGIEVANG